MINVRLLPGYNNMRDESKIEIYLIKIFCKEIIVKIVVKIF